MFCIFYILFGTTAPIYFAVFQCSVAKGVLHKRCSERFRKVHKKTPVLESLFNKIFALRPATVLKETSAQIFSSKFCKTAASEIETLV